MEKIEKYVVFKYEDEFGFHYMKMDKLPGSYHPSVVFRRRQIGLCIQLQIRPRGGLVAR